MSTTVATYLTSCNLLLLKSCVDSGSLGIMSLGLNSIEKQKMYVKRNDMN